MKLWIIALASLLWAAAAVAAPPVAVDLPACGELPSPAGQESRIRLAWWHPPPARPWRRTWPPWGN
jgi:hypothetical protein